jgi:hypothetical protein
VSTAPRIDAETAETLVNALCVNGTTKLPGDGAHEFIKWYNPEIDYKNLSVSKKAGGTASCL